MADAWIQISSGTVPDNDPRGMLEVSSVRMFDVVYDSVADAYHVQLHTDFGTFVSVTSHATLDAAATSILAFVGSTIFSI